MATWNGEPKKFRVEFCCKDPYYTEYGDVEFSWEYNTTADILELKSIHPNMTENKNVDLRGPDWAEAELYTLADWMATYNSPEALTNLLKPIFDRYKE